MMPLAKEAGVIEMHRGGGIRAIPKWVLHSLFQWPEAGVEEDKALLIED